MPTDDTGLASDPIEAMFDRADRLDESGQHEEAVLGYQDILSLRPDLAPVHHNLGLSLKALGRTEEALAHFSQAAALSPEAQFLSSLGNFLLLLNRPALSLEPLRKAFALNPRSFAASMQSAASARSRRRGGDRL